jgi:hypothetical protein
MRLFVSLLAILGAAIAPSMAAENGAVSGAERAPLTELEQSKKAFLASISGLGGPVDGRVVHTTMERGSKPESRQNGDCGRARNTQTLKSNAP